MTEQYLRNITADYITGAVSACEGIRNSLVLLNGPLGCRFYHGYASGQSVMKSSELWSLGGALKLSNAMDDRLLRSQYFAGTSQVPGSNLRYEDNIFGTREQLHRALNDIFSERRYSLLAVIQTPGTSLLGEALEGELEQISAEFELPYFFLETPLLSENFNTGYDETMVRLLQRLLPRHRGQSERPRGPTVNLFGLSTYQRYLEGDAAEILRLLSLCHISVNCVAGANCTMDSFQKIPQADLNIMLSPERCAATARCLRDYFGLPVLICDSVPIGFDLTERFVQQIAGELQVDASAALEEIQKARARAFYFIARHVGEKGIPRHVQYAVEGEYSLLYAYVDFLSGYLGMMPQAVHPLGTTYSRDGRARLEGLLQKFGALRALHHDISEVRDAIVLASAGTILSLSAYSENNFGIETAFPSSGYLHVVPKTHWGCSGALFLLEQILNGVRLLTAWD